MTPIQFLDYSGVAVFAATGALAASRKQLDIVGFIFLAAITGIGGGTLRDVILNVPVFWIANTHYVLICAAVAVLVFFTAHLLESRWKWLLWLDAIGLAAFAAMGLPLAWRERRADAVAFLIATVLPAWLIFEAVPTKLPHYVLPLMPWLAILTILALRRGELDPHRRGARAVALLVPAIPVGLTLGLREERPPGLDREAVGAGHAEVAPRRVQLGQGPAQGRAMVDPRRLDRDAFQEGHDHRRPAAEAP